MDSKYHYYMHHAMTATQIARKMASNLPLQDEILQFVLKHGQILQKISDSNILIYGGTGFIGKWFLSILSQASQQLDLRMNVTVVSRNPASAREIFPSDVNIVSYLEIGQLPPHSHVIFGASSATSTDLKDLEESYDTARSAITLSASQKIPPNFINLSSGASKLADLSSSTVREVNSYPLLKRRIENLVELETIAGNLCGTNPRLYSFIGPLLPLDSKYAAGNFMKNCLLGEDVRITGNPATVRSYLYPLELISKILILLHEPISNPIDIGGTESVSILQLARAISDAFGRAEVILPKSESPSSIYVPDPSLNLIENQEISLTESIQRWKSWFES